MSLANKLIVSFGAILIFLLLSNPGEMRYLDRISLEYGSTHHGMKFSPSRLLEIGSGNRTDFLFMSEYKYTFGNISVNYFGIGGIIFKAETLVPQKPNKGKPKGIIT